MVPEVDSLFDPDADTAAAVAEPTLTVAQLSSAIRGLLQRQFGEGLWVAGQIRNLSTPRSGHVYFDLVEPIELGRNPEHKISITLFRQAASAVRRQLADGGGQVELEDGIEVRIGGRLSWYAAGGRLQFNMDRIDPAFTLGRLQQDRDRLLRLLSTEGLLRANAVHPVPAVPLRVGIVTSETSAAAADVLNELRGSGFAFDIRLADARTQGVDCGPSVIAALQRLAGEALDVVLLVRGGGATTDLVGFDGEDVARAIAAMPVPVFTGIGHEIDRTIADEVAHTAHKTPTAAAGALVALVRAFIDRLDATWTQTSRAASTATARAAGRLDEHAGRLVGVTGRALDRGDDQIDGAARRLVRAAGSSLDRADERLLIRARAIAPSGMRVLTGAETALSLIEARIGAHDPAAALARGWSITTTDDGLLVRDPAELGAGSVINTRLAAGHIRSTVVDTRPLESPAAGADRDGAADPAFAPDTNHPSAPTD